MFFSQYYTFDSVIGKKLESSHASGYMKRLFLCVAKNGRGLGMRQKIVYLLFIKCLLKMFLPIAMLLSLSYVSLLMTHNTTHTQTPTHAHTHTHTQTPS